MSQFVVNSSLSLALCFFLSSLLTFGAAFQTHKERERENPNPRTQNGPKIRTRSKTTPLELTDPQPDPIRDLHAPTRRRSSARRDVDPGRRDRTSGDRSGGAGDGGDARADLLRALRRARRHEESPRGSHGLDQEEQGVLERRTGYSDGRWSQLAEHAAEKGARSLRFARQLLQPTWTPHAPRERRYRCY